MRLDGAGLGRLQNANSEDRGYCVAMDRPAFLVGGDGATAAELRHQRKSEDAAEICYGESDAKMVTNAYINSRATHLAIRNLGSYYG